MPLLLGNINHQHVLRFRTYSSTSIQSRYQIVYLYSPMLRLLLVIAIREWTENVSKICRKRYQTQKKIPKIYFESLWSKIEDYFRLFQSRNRSKTSGRYSWWYICNRKKFQKLFQAIEANSKTTFDYFSPEIDRKRAEDISDDIFATENNSKNYSKPSKHNERLFSMKAFYKLINNVRMTCLMIYRARKNSPKIFRAISCIFWGYFWL